MGQGHSKFGLEFYSSKIDSTSRGRGRTGRHGPLENATGQTPGVAPRRVSMHAFELFLLVILCVAPSSGLGPLTALQRRTLNLQAGTVTRRHSRKIVAAIDEDKKPATADGQESLYGSPANFEFDAVTVTAVLGTLIAFQFFVIANL